METAELAKLCTQVVQSQHFFGSGINGNAESQTIAPTAVASQHFFGSGINGNNAIVWILGRDTFGHNTSSEVELMETCIQSQL